MRKMWDVLSTEKKMFKTSFVMKDIDLFSFNFYISYPEENVRFEDQTFWMGDATHFKLLHADVCSIYRHIYNVHNGCMYVCMNMCVCIYALISLAIV